MRIRIESPLTVSAGLFKPVKTRYVATVGNVVHWYEISQRDLDVFLREIYHHYDYNYAQKTYGRDEYVWYASLTVYYRGTTVALNLSRSCLYHDPN